MKALIICLILLTGLLAGTTVFGGWEFHKMPGGVILETVIVDETVNSTEVEGALILEKHGGIYWLPWDNDIDDWGTIEEYDAYYVWWMGGDAKKIDDDLFAIAATYLGTHLYEYTGGSPHSWDPVGTRVPNAYYRWHDAAFYEDQNGGGDESNFILSAVQEWHPSGYTYNKGLFLVTDGNSPSEGANAITGTSGNSYSFIYRDLEGGDTLYTWYNEKYPDAAKFQRITVSGTVPNVTASVDDDFDEEEIGYDLKEITGFYQYLEGSDNRHQYIVAKTKGQVGDPAPTWDVWHREESGGSLASNGWYKVWSDMDEYGGAMGIVAEEDGDYHKIYVAVQNLGLIHHYDDDETQLNYQESYDTYLTNWHMRSLNLNPWYDCDQLIIGTGHASGQFANINIDNDPSVVKYFNEDGMGSGIYDTALKGGCSTREIAVRGDTVIFATHGSGVYMADTDTWVSYEEIGVDDSPSSLDEIKRNADFNFTWECVAFSPWDADELYLGAYERSFKLNHSTVEHGGLWNLDFDNDYVTVVTDNVLSGKRISSLGTDYDYDNLYIGRAIEFNASTSTIVDHPTLYCKSTSGGGLTEITNTGTNGLNEAHRFAYYGCAYEPNFYALQAHPADGVEGVVWGLGLPGSIAPYDWDEDPNTTCRSQYIGGGLGYSYYDNGWNTVEILGCDHENLGNDLEWFEGVKDILVESNTSTDTTHQDVDMLVASGVYQISHLSEDIPRYGGLWKVYYNNGSWQKINVTPYQDDVNGVRYQLNGDNFNHPGVMSVEKLAFGNSNYYFCNTMGEKAGSQDEWLSILWWQQADDIRSVSQSNWSLFPIQGFDDGEIPYDDNNNFINNYSFLVIIKEEIGGTTDINVKIIAASYPLGIQTYWAENNIESDKTWEGNIFVTDDITVSNSATLTLAPDCQVNVMGTYSKPLTAATLKFNIQTAIGFCSLQAKMSGGME